MLEPLRPARRRVDGWASSLRFAGLYVARALRARGAMSIDPVTMEESIKRLSPDPWERYVNHCETGETVDATITRVMPYGGFARVADGVEGLIHISEIASEPVGDPNEAVRIGQVLPVWIVAIDRERRRLSLSARLTQST